MGIVQTMVLHGQRLPMKPYPESVQVLIPSGTLSCQSGYLAGQSTSRIRVRNSSGGFLSEGGGSSSSKGGSGYTTWILDDIGWWLKYADGSYAKGNITTDAAGSQTEIPYWGFVNSKWFAFGASGYIMTGWIYDPVYKYWFYNDVNKGMLTGWQLLNNKWYYFNLVSDGTRTSLREYNHSDGYKVGTDGSWIQ